MLQIKHIAVLVFILLLSACIKAYDPVINTDAENKYVVTGRVTNTEGWQEVDVSRSSPVGTPKNIPIGGCQVQILDDKGNSFKLDEWKPGIYRSWIEQKYLIPGTSYKVSVVVPGGDELESGFDKMSKGPPLDSVYYILKDVPTPDPNRTRQVMQFYVDLDARGDYSQYYKWEIDETWEYHAARPLEWYYDGAFHQVDPPDYTNKICWITQPVMNVFNISTKNVVGNVYRQYPLHFIDGTTSRLGYIYSMLVRQFSLSEGAYNYWDQLRINSNDQGGLYEKQPLAIKGNMVTVNHPEKVVLGYFYAASESGRRYFYHDVEGIQLTFSDYCFEEGLGLFRWKEFGPNDYPVFFYYSAQVVRILNRECIDCRLLGGTTTKPDFWPR